MHAQSCLPKAVVAGPLEAAGALPGSSDSAETGGVQWAKSGGKSGSAAVALGEVGPASRTGLAALERGSACPTRGTAAATTRTHSATACRSAADPSGAARWTARGGGRDSGPSRGVPCRPGACRPMPRRASPSQCSAPQRTERVTSFAERRQAGPEKTGQQQEGPGERRRQPLTRRRGFSLETHISGTMEGWPRLREAVWVLAVVALWCARNNPSHSISPPCFHSVPDLLCRSTSPPSPPLLAWSQPTAGGGGFDVMGRPAPALSGTLGSGRAVFPPTAGSASQCVAPPQVFIPVRALEARTGGRFTREGGTRSASYSQRRCSRSLARRMTTGILDGVAWNYKR